MTARITGQDRILSERAWTIVALALQDAARRAALDASLLTVTFPEEPGGPSVEAEVAVVRNTRSCDVLGRLGRSRLGVIAVGCDIERAGLLGRRLQEVLRSEGVEADVSVATPAASAGDDGDEAAPETTPETTPEAASRCEPTFGSSGPVTKYAPCNACGRNGVYVSGRFPVIRCKYCGAKRSLTAEQWQGANSNLGEMARRLPSSLLGMELLDVNPHADG